MSSPTISHYRINNKLGAGGMGEVYLAEDTKLHRKVAIKLLPKQAATDERARKRLLREAQAAATLDHPNICSIYEVNQEADQTFIVMQYLEGETLASKLQKGPLPLTESLGLAVQIADALTDAHAHGIIHRDIKPENVMYTLRGEAKVMDFGLAKIVQDENAPTSQASTRSLLTERGTVVGTLLYMSPEQVKGETLDVRSDIFSLGSLMYEMFTGKQPFASTNSAGTISALLTHQPPPLTRYTDVPAELQRIVLKCLEKDKERRYSSARELLIDLRNLSSDSQQGKVETVTAPVGHVRPRWIYIAVGLALIAATIAVIYLLQQSRAHSGTQIHSLAVLPFANPSADPSIDYLGDGLTESLINSLSKFSQLKVIARTTAFRYKGKEIDPQLVGKELQVDAIVTGRVTKQGDTLIIQTDLLNAADGSQIWGGRYSRKASDIFAVQEQIAKEISGTLPLTPTGEEEVGLSKRYTNNIDAYQNYLQGQRFAQLRTRDDLKKSISYFEKAIQSDESYALAYAGLSQAYTSMVARLYIAPPEGRRKAGEAGLKALSLDANLAEAHAAIGMIGVFFVPHDFPTADRELRRAIELSPNLAIAHQFLGLSLLEQGRLDDALAELLKARELDPLSPAIARALATAYYLKRDSPRAIETLRNAFDLGPPFVISVEILIYLQSGHLDEALRILDQVKQERPDDPVLTYSRGMVYAAQGRRAEAFQAINELTRLSGLGTGFTFHSSIARISSTLKEKDLALEWLNRGVQAESITLFYKDDPVWEPIRDDKRFDELLRKMEIPVN